jgi:uncharacterized membrane protein
MAVVLLLVAGFHVAGAVFSNRFAALATALHAVGTLSLGAGIALTGQIFNLAEHWPSAVLLWAVGAACGYLLLRDWPQLAFTAILGPWWLAAEWVVRRPAESAFAVPGFLLLFAFSYLTAGTSSDERRVLTVLGSVALLPLGVAAAAIPLLDRRHVALPGGGTWAAWGLALLLPLAVALRLRGRQAWLNAVAAAWVVVLALSAHRNWNLFVHLWCALGAVGLIAWGRREMRTERINLGVAGFAVTILFFYFSNVMDKLGRSASLISLGLLFLGGGWLLERGRRRLIAQIRGGSA